MVGEGSSLVVVSPLSVSCWKGKMTWERMGKYRKGLKTDCRAGRAAHRFHGPPDKFFERAPQTFSAHRSFSIFVVKLMSIVIGLALLCFFDLFSIILNLKS
jgi:hypothetical protein